MTWLAQQLSRTRVRRTHAAGHEEATRRWWQRPKDMMKVRCCLNQH